MWTAKRPGELSVTVFMFWRKAGATSDPPLQKTDITPSRTSSIWRGYSSELLKEAIGNHRVDLHVLKTVVVNGDGSTSELLKEAIADHGVDLQVLKAVVNGNWLQVLQEAM